MSLKEKLAPVIAAAGLSIDAGAALDNKDLSAPKPDSTPSASQMIRLGEKLEANASRLNLGALNAGPIANLELAGALHLTFAVNNVGSSKLETAMHLDGAQSAFSKILNAPDSNNSHKYAASGLARTEKELERA